MDLKFKAVVWKAGKSRVVTIPGDFIKYGQLVTGKTYDFSVTIEQEGEVDKQ